MRRKQRKWHPWPDYVPLPSETAGDRAKTEAVERKCVFARGYRFVVYNDVTHSRPKCGFLRRSVYWLIRRLFR